MRLKGKYAILLFFTLFFNAIIPRIQVLYSYTTGELGIPIRGETKSSKYWNLTGSRIYIDDAHPNYTWGKTASNYEWCSGIGTWDDPYIIENITINCQTLEYGIQIRNSHSFFKVKNCSVYNQGWISGHGAIYLYNVSNGRLTNNTISSSYNGIRLYQCKDNIIDRNIVLNNNWGVAILSSVNNSILNTTFKRNKYGIWLAGINLYGLSYDNTIYNNNISNNQNGMFINGYTNQIVKNIIYNSSEQGINLCESHYSVISTNLISCNNQAIYLFDSFNNNITDNTINFNEIGIYFIRSCYNLFCKNSFLGNQKNYDGENYDLDCENTYCSSSITFNVGLIIVIISVISAGIIIMIFIEKIRTRIRFKIK